MGYTQHLFEIMSDGAFHSGEALSRQLGVSRTSVWNYIRSLKDLGLDIYAVQGQGYRLEQAVEPLDAEKIKAHLDPDVAVPALDLHWSIESSNTRLLELAKQGAPSGQVCMTELQTAGRGRRGRDWCSPLGGNIYLSVLWRFQQGAAALSGLNIATAMALSTAIKRLASHCGAELSDLRLKWPNDVLYQGKKLAGIFMDVSGEASGPCVVVLGVGLNVAMNTASAQRIDQPWTDLSTGLNGKSVPRNLLASFMVSEFYRMFRLFEQQGLQPFISQWDQLDAYAGQSVRLQSGHDSVTGIARGVDSDGALLVQVQDEIRRFYSAEVSLRQADSDSEVSV